jgi:hypothetical protein
MQHGASARALGAHKDRLELQEVARERGEGVAGDGAAHEAVQRATADADALMHVAEVSMRAAASPAPLAVHIGRRGCLQLLHVAPRAARAVAAQHQAAHHAEEARMLSGNPAHDRSRVDACSAGCSVAAADKRAARGQTMRGLVARS